MSIINWELHQKLMENKTTITVCTGIGMNQFFPEYTTIELSNTDNEIKEEAILPLENEQK